jgi:nicotinate phosphoribosyltransferase
MKFPESYEPYTDKYFLRTKEILKRENLNPFARAQVFIRKGPGKVKGIDEAVELLEHYGNISEKGGRIYTLDEGQVYSPKETIMLIEAPVQNIVALETMYLGIITAETTLANDNIDIDLDAIEKNAKEIVEAAQERPVSYFGARHWKYDRDYEISAAAFKGGFSSSATDIGAAILGQKGIGTIPHILENVMAWKYGTENAVLESIKAFDRVIDPSIPRISLIDYRNKEVDDAVRSAEVLDGRLYGIRIDTCGENISQGGKEKSDTSRQYWDGPGVTVSGVHAVRKALDDNGYSDVKIILSSGFGNTEKIKAFIEAEKDPDVNTKLFDALGVGGLYHARTATMDVVAVGESIESMEPISKVGRSYKPNSRLRLR